MAPFRPARDLIIRAPGVPEGTRVVDAVVHAVRLGMHPRDHPVACHPVATGPYAICTPQLLAECDRGLRALVPPPTVSA